LVYLKPGEAMSMRSDPLDPLHMMMVLFDCCAIRCELGAWGTPRTISDLGWDRIQVVPLKQTAEVSSRFRQLADVWVPGNPERERTAEAKLQCLMADLRTLIDAMEQPRSMEAEFRNVREALERQFKERSSIEQLCAAYGISPSYLR